MNRRTKSVLAINKLAKKPFRQQNATIGTTVVEVRAIDADIGPNGAVRYRLRKDAGGGWRAFSVQATSGALRTTQPLDRDKQTVYQVKNRSIWAQNNGFRQCTKVIFLLKLTRHFVGKCHTIKAFRKRNGNSNVGRYLVFSLRPPKTTPIKIELQIKELSKVC